MDRREQQQRRLLSAPGVRGDAEQLGIVGDATGQPVVERRVVATLLVGKAHKALRQRFKLRVGYRLHHRRSSGTRTLCYPASLLRPQRRTKSSRPWTTQRLCPTPARLGETLLDLRQYDAPKGPSSMVMALSPAPALLRPGVAR